MITLKEITFVCGCQIEACVNMKRRIQVPKLHKAQQQKHKDKKTDQVINKNQQYTEWNELSEEKRTKRTSNKMKNVIKFILFPCFCLVLSFVCLCYIREAEEYHHHIKMHRTWERPSYNMHSCCWCNVINFINFHSVFWCRDYIEPDVAPAHKKSAISTLHKQFNRITTASSLRIYDFYKEVAIKKWNTQLFWPISVEVR